MKLTPQTTQKKIDPFYTDEKDTDYRTGALKYI